MFILQNFICSLDFVVDLEAMNDGWERKNETEIENKKERKKVERSNGGRGVGG